MTYTMARQRCYEVEDFVRTAAELNMEGIDWVTTYGRAPSDLRKMSEDAGLAVACHTFILNRLRDGKEDWLDEAKQSLDDAVNLGAPVVMIPTMDKPEIPRDTFHRFWIDALKQIAPLAEDAGVILTVENFPGAGSAFVTADDYLQAKREVPSLKLTYDNGNAASGEDPVESFEKCRDDVVHTHFKDWYISDTPKEGYRQMLNGKYFQPALIGEGDIDTPACWNAMRNAGYDKYINIEYEGNDVPAAEGIRKVVEYLRSL